MHEPKHSCCREVDGNKKYWIKNTSQRKIYVTFMSKSDFHTTTELKLDEFDENN